MKSVITINNIPNNTTKENLSRIHCANLNHVPRSSSVSDEIAASRPFFSLFRSIRLRSEPRALTIPEAGNRSAGIINAVRSFVGTATRCPRFRLSNDDVSDTEKNSNGAFSSARTPLHPSLPTWDSRPGLSFTDPSTFSPSGFDLRLYIDIVTTRRGSRANGPRYSRGLIVLGTQMRFLTECPRARNRMRIIGSIRRTLARENQPEDRSKGSCSRARSHLSDRGRSPRACHLFHSTVHDLERRVTGVCLSTRRDGIDLVAWTPLLNGRAQFN